MFMTFLLNVAQFSMLKLIIRRGRTRMYCLCDIQQCLCSQNCYLAHYRLPFIFLETEMTTHYDREYI
ncbi:hypothetical protein SLA2020_105540 [Shorea laevis]